MIVGGFRRIVSGTRRRFSFRGFRRLPGVHFEIGRGPSRLPSDDDCALPRFFTCPGLRCTRRSNECRRPTRTSTIRRRGCSRRPPIGDTTRSRSLSTTNRSRSRSVHHTRHGCCVRAYADDGNIIVVNILRENTIRVLYNTRPRYDFRVYFFEIRFRAPTPLQNTSVSSHRTGPSTTSTRFVRRR